MGEIITSTDQPQGYTGYAENISQQIFCYAEDSDTYKEMITVFLTASDTMFDISSCKCQPIESCAFEKSKKSQ